MSIFKALQNDPEQSAVEKFADSVFTLKGLKTSDKGNLA